jgi:hypothetical protein
MRKTILALVVLSGLGVACSSAPGDAKSTSNSDALSFGGGTTWFNGPDVAGAVETGVFAFMPDEQCPTIWLRSGTWAAGQLVGIPGDQWMASWGRGSPILWDTQLWLDAQNPKWNPNLTPEMVSGQQPFCVYYYEFYNYPRSGADDLVAGTHLADIAAQGGTYLKPSYTLILDSKQHVCKATIPCSSTDCDCPADGAIGPVKPR